MQIVTDILSLEVTQMCNLDCKHCLQGKSCAVFMSDKVIYNIFKEVKMVINRRESIFGLRNHKKSA